MARFEEEAAGCNSSAGPDYGVHLGKVMALALQQVEVDCEKFIELLYDQVGNVLSKEDIVRLENSINRMLNHIAS